MELKRLISKGAIEFKNNNYEKALKIFLDSLKKYPNEVLPYTYLIPTLINQNKLLEALKYADRVIYLDKNSDIGFTYKGIVFFKKSEFNKALKYFEEGLKINPNNFHNLLNSGIIHHKQKNNGVAIEYLKKSISINDKNFVAYQNLASIYEDESRFEEAIENFQKAISLNPKDYDSIHGLSLIQLSKLDFKNGWQNYESRFRKSNHQIQMKYNSIKRLDTLENIEGKNVLIWHEQGLGDTIQFSRYVQKLSYLNVKITFEVQSALSSFLKKQYNFVIKENIKHLNFDYQCPLLSLPNLFVDEKSKVLEINNYFKPDKDKVKKWKNHLKLSNDKINLGIAISGNPNNLKEQRRKIGLKELLIINEYCKIYIIQKELDKEDKNTLKNNKDLVYLGENDEWINFDDTSAIVENMDIILSIDTSLIHLAGSMNKKSFLLLSKPADWRWTEDNYTTPNWYDNVKILRQKKAGSWLSVLKEVKEEVKRISSHL